MKRPELAAAVDPDDLTGNDDDAIAHPSASPDKREVAPEAAATKQQPEDVQLKKALELLRDNKSTPQKTA